MDAAVIALSTVPDKNPSLRCSALREGWDEFTRERVDQLQGPFWGVEVAAGACVEHHPSWAGTIRALAP